jgi:hypothetical protein
MSVNVAVEGFVDEVVVRSVLQWVNIQPVLVRSHGGKTTLLRQIPKYNQAANFANWLVVVDLDNEDCAPGYRKQLLPQPSEGMLLRIPVREVEAWLLADAEHLAAYFNISASIFPDRPDNENDPKQTLMNLARRSRKTDLREDIVPRQNSGAKIGPGYPARIQEFVQHTKHPWRPEVAMQNSDSLRRCIDALKNWKMIGS